MATPSTEKNPTTGNWMSSAQLLKHFTGTEKKKYSNNDLEKYTEFLSGGTRGKYSDPEDIICYHIERRDLEQETIAEMKTSDIIWFQVFGENEKTGWLWYFHHQLEVFSHFNKLCSLMLTD